MIDHLRDCGGMAGAEELLKGGLDAPGLRIFHRNKVRLGVGVHLDALHLGLVHEEVEGGPGQVLLMMVAASHLTLPVHAGPVGAADGPRPWERKERVHT